MTVVAIVTRRGALEPVLDVFCGFCDRRPLVKFEASKGGCSVPCPFKGTNEDSRASCSP